MNNREQIESEIRILREKIALKQELIKKESFNKFENDLNKFVKLIEGKCISLNNDGTDVFIKVKTAKVSNSSFNSGSCCITLSSNKDIIYHYNGNNFNMQGKNYYIWITIDQMNDFLYGRNIRIIDDNVFDNIHSEVTSTIKSIKNNIENISRIKKISLEDLKD